MKEREKKEEEEGGGGEERGGVGGEKGGRRRERPTINGNKYSNRINSFKTQLCRIELIFLAYRIKTGFQPRGNTLH